MHNWAKSIMECVKAKVDGMGVDNIEGKNLEELKAWACIAKDISEYDYYYHIVEAMEEPEEEYGKTYDENGRMGYNRMRDSRGRYMARRGYVEPIPYEEDWTPIMAYNNNMGRGYSSNAEMNRDMDMATRNAMYYSGENSRMMPESRYESAKRGYEEVKDVKSLNKVFDVIEADVKELKPHMDANEIATVRQRLTSMASMMV